MDSEESIRFHVFAEDSSFIYYENPYGDIHQFSSSSNKSVRSVQSANQEPQSKSKHINKLIYKGMPKHHHYHILLLISHYFD